MLSIIDLVKVQYFLESNYFDVQIIRLYLEQDYIDIKVLKIVQKILISYHFSFSNHMLLRDSICVEGLLQLVR